MKFRAFGFIILLTIGCLTITGCHKSENVKTKNSASIYCEENGGTLQIEEGAGLCMFPDGSYCEEGSYQKGECKPGEIMYNIIGEKTSLTSDELNTISEINFPTSYTYTSFNKDSDKAIDDGAFNYPSNTSHTLLIPEHENMISREVISSNIEDGMIYTDTKVTLQDNTNINILYIVNPETLKFVAASVENNNIITNYQFSY